MMICYFSFLGQATETNNNTTDAVHATEEKAKETDHSAHGKLMKKKEVFLLTDKHLCRKSESSASNSRYMLLVCLFFLFLRN